ncbi:MAG: 2-oxoacid:ferredoxin oxidoreductase subunit alpha [Patescibacteria group bacterium]|nr:MAG: 2-oxoacid:ferredoxin oxidoreductase subunit alpha [Patescibacteria group bacterium]
MTYLHRFVVKVAGESGMGINSVGEVLAKALKNVGMFVFGYREYPSLIKGGYSCYQLDISDTKINASSSECDVLLSFSRVSLHAYLNTVREGGSVIHSVIQVRFTPEEEKIIADRRLTVVYLPAREMAITIGGNKIMENTVMLGAIWQVLDLDLEELKSMITEQFAKKPEVIPGNINCLEAGYTFKLEGVSKSQLDLRKTENFTDDYLLTGNHAIALGAVAGGVRAYYAYPMTPSSSILSYLADISHETGMLVKQIEDEISVANMAVGSMFAGARTLIGTAGGGFDLMTETVSLSGITETPFMCILAQRPGPATGLPTWTSSSDLNIAVYAGHGEYTRLVLAASDIESCFILTQVGLNMAEKYQIPVILLTEKQIAESIFQVNRMPDPIPIERHILSNDDAKKMKSEDRFAITETGISPRWLPGQSEAVYTANSDEHLPDGTLTEEADTAWASYNKRLRKEKTLLEELPEPIVFGDPNADISFVGWGSVKNTMLDVMACLSEFTDKKISYLHYEYLYPVKTKVLKEYAKKAKRLVLVENNATGQLGQIVTAKTEIPFWEKVLKCDGRPFFVEDIVNFILGGSSNAV